MKAGRAGRTWSSISTRPSTGRRTWRGRSHLQHLPPRRRSPPLRRLLRQSRRPRLQHHRSHRHRPRGRTGPGPVVLEMLNRPPIRRNPPRETPTTRFRCQRPRLPARHRLPRQPWTFLRPSSHRPKLRRPRTPTRAAWTLENASGCASLRRWNEARSTSTMHSPRSSERSREAYRRQRSGGQSPGTPPSG